MAVIEGRLRLVVQGADADLVVDHDPTTLPGPGEEATTADPAPRRATPRAPTPRLLPPSREDVAAGRERYEVTIDGWVFVVTVESADRAELRERATRLSAAGGHAGPQTLNAKIPGRVARIWVEVGTEVQHGDRLLSIEAMKMENEIRAPRAGTVVSVAVAVGDRVELGSELAVVG